MSSIWYSKGGRGSSAGLHSDDSLNDSFVMDQDDPALLEAFFNKHMVDRNLRRRHSYANSLNSARGSSRIITPGLSNVPSKDLPREMYMHASNASAKKPFTKSKSYYTQKNPKHASEYSREKTVDHAASEIIGKFRVLKHHTGNNKRQSLKERMYLSQMPEETRGKIPSIIIRKEEKLEEDDTAVYRVEQGTYEYYNELLNDLAHGTDADGGPSDQIKKVPKREQADDNNKNLFLKTAPSINLPFFICGTGEDTDQETCEYHRALKQIKNELPKVRKANTYLYFDSNRDQRLNVKKAGPVKHASKKRDKVNSIKSASPRKDFKIEEHGTFFERLMCQVKSKKRHRRSLVH